MGFTRPEVRAILGDAHTEEIENKLISLYLGEKDKLKEKIDNLTSENSRLKEKIDNLTSENSRLKADSEKLESVQKELDTLKGGEDWKAKYEKEHNDFETFKTSVNEKETLSQKQSAYSKLLADEQINEKHIKDVVRLTDFSKITLDKDGKLENVDALKKAIGEEWSEYKVTTVQKKQQVGNPPSGNNGSGESRARELYLNHLKQQGIKVEDAGKE